MANRPASSCRRRMSRSGSGSNNVFAIAEKLAALHTLSAGVAHELRNPLSAMDLNLHLLEEELKEQGPLTADGTAHYVQVLNAECRRLSAILDNFMKFARPGSVDAPRSGCSSGDRTYRRTDATSRQGAKIRLEQTMEDDLPPVLGDETAISQVLVNVLVNAFHAMADGGRCQIAAKAPGRRKTLGRTFRGRHRRGHTGGSMPRLFDPFYTTKPSGSGLGLAIAYRIMQDHGGLIRYRECTGNWNHRRAEVSCTCD